MKKEVSNDFIEKSIIYTLFKDKTFLHLIINSTQDEYFENTEAGKVFKIIKDHWHNYQEIPSSDIVKNSLDDEDHETSEFLKDVQNLDLDLTENYNFVFDNTEAWLKEQALKKAVLDTSWLIKNGEYEKFSASEEYIKNALTKTLKTDVGLDYFNTISDRLKRIFSATDVRVPTYYPQFDEFINGGFPPFTLNIIAGTIHGGKCVSYNTQIEIKDENNNMYDIKIGELFDDYEIEEESDDDLIKEEKIIKNTSVKSDIGYVPINKIFKTHKLRKYLILFNSGNKIECAYNHLFIKSSNEYVYAKNLNPGDKLIGNKFNDIVFDVFDTGKYEYFYDIEMKYHHLYYTNNILSHNSNQLANWARRQAYHGHQPVIITLEMAQDDFARRIDSGLSGLDINRIYDTKKNELISSLKDAKQNRKGELFIKQFPTGTATVNDIKTYLYELQIRDYKPGPIYVDYLNLMKPTFIENDGGNLYTKNKRVAEELRALSYEFETPVISPVQLTTEGMQAALSDLGYWHVAECLDLETIVDKYFPDEDIFKKIKIKDLNIGDQIKGSHNLVNVDYIFPRKKKKKYKIKLKSGKEIYCSDDHKFPTDNGLKSINTGLNIGDKLNSIDDEE